MFKLNTHIIGLVGLVAGLVLSATGCRRDEPEPPVPPQTVERTVLVYMVANNNLGAAGYDRADLEEMFTAARAGHTGAGRLLVYHDGTTGQPVLIEIGKGARVDTLVRYDGAAYAVEIARMSRVFDDMERLAPAEEYGLVLWSHGTGWIQDGIAEDGGGRAIAPQSFGQDRGRTMNVTSLARALAGRDFSFLYFDCCYMASVETLYELRYAVPLVAGSATELPVAGSRYDLNVASYFAPLKADIVGAARKTYEHYNSLTGPSRTCTMSVVSTAGLDELAAATAAIYERSSRGLPEGYSPQRFSDTSVASCRYFDFRDYVAALCTDASGSERFAGAQAMLSRFDEALAACVEYAAATPKLWNTVALDRHCGLSTYILKNSADAASTKNYNSLAWYADVASLLK